MKKILIVDDQPDIRRLINLALGRRYEITEANDGTGALTQISANRPDAIILDVMMPGGIDGIDVLKHVKNDKQLHDDEDVAQLLVVLDVAQLHVKNDKQLRDVFVVMVTAKGQAGDLESAMRAGADGYLIKPFSPLQLMALLQEHFGS